MTQRASDRGVRALLVRHRPADEREAGFVDEMLALLDAADAPFSRQHFVPGHLTASAFVTSADGSNVLLVLHGKLHRWLQPGGHFEPDDVDLFAAARREVAEETGIDGVELGSDEALLDVDIHDIPAIRGDPPHRHYDLRVHLRCRDAEPDTSRAELPVRWVPIDADAEAMLGRASDESVFRALRRLRGR